LAVETGENPLLLDRLINVGCQVGLLANGQGQTAISVALNANKGTAIRNLLRAVLEQRFQLTPASMQYLSRTFPKLSASYPKAFLHLLSNCPLIDEPEVLEGQQTQAVKLESRLIVGSGMRCPKGMWRQIILKFSQTPVGLLPVSDENKIADGYPRSKGGVRAVRVPFESFAGEIVGTDGEHHSLLKLILNAVTSTHDYSIFASEPMRILVQYKWEGFARQLVAREMILFVVHLMMTTVFTLEASKKIGASTSEILNNFEQHWFLIVGWTLTSMVSLQFLRSQVRNLDSFEKLRRLDYQDYINMIYNLAQIAVNVLFWLRDSMPAAFSPANTTGLYDLSELYADGTLIETSMRPADAGEELGIYITLQSWVMVALYLRLLFYFRASEQFGALMHMVIVVFQQVIPFLLLLIVVWLGFSFAIALLMRHTVYRYPDYVSIYQSLWTMMSAGFRFVPPELAATNARWQVLFLYCIYLWFVSVILLNMLIAMMGQSLGIVRLQANNMAAFEHAKLVMLQEEKARFARKPRFVLPPASEDEEDGDSFSRGYNNSGTRNSSGDLGDLAAKSNAGGRRPRLSNGTVARISAGCINIGAAVRRSQEHLFVGGASASSSVRESRRSSCERKRSVSSISSEAILASAEALATATNGRRLLTKLGWQSSLTQELVNPKWLHVLMPIVETQERELNTHQMVESVQQQVVKLEGDVMQRFDKLEETLKELLTDKSPREGKERERVPRLDQVAGGKGKQATTPNAPRTW